VSVPPLNPISQRLPFDVEGKAEPEVVANLRYNTSSIVDLNQAISALKTQVDAAHSTAKSAVSAVAAAVVSSGVTSFNTLAGNVTYFPFLGHVNDQLGNPAYTTQGSDDGAKIIVGDSSAVAITLDASVSLPWFTIIDNDSSSVATLTPSAGTLHGETTIPPMGFGIVFFDGVDWWCGAVRLASCGQFGYVRPDCVSIGFDSSTGSIRTIGIDSTIATAPLTIGGSPGSMVFLNGLLISSVQAT
jgi:hypothetical protein